MRAAWWWIDRWRKSTAYTDMTLAEQGAYRNLLDELWLRGGVLPNDDRILAKVCGDAMAWPSVRDKVLARFTLTSAGWRNHTHDEVSAGSKFHKSQSDKGKKGAAARWGRNKEDSPGNSPANSPGNSPQMAFRTPSPSPYSVTGSNNEPPPPPADAGGDSDFESVVPLDQDDDDEQPRTNGVRASVDRLVAHAGKNGLDVSRPERKEIARRLKTKLATEEQILGELDKAIAHQAAAAREGQVLQVAAAWVRERGGETKVAEEVLSKAHEGETDADVLARLEAPPGTRGILARALHYARKPHSPPEGAAAKSRAGAGERGA